MHRAGARRERGPGAPPGSPVLLHIGLGTRIQWRRHRRVLSNTNNSLHLQMAARAGPVSLLSGPAATNSLPSGRLFR